MTPGFGSAAILVFILSTMLASPAAVAFSPPEEESPAGPGAAPQLQALWLTPGPLGQVNNGIAMVDLGGPHATEQEVVAAVEAHLSANPVLLGGLDQAQDLALTWSATSSDIVYVQFVQRIPVENLTVAGTYVHFSVRQIAGQSLVLGGRVHLYPDILSLLPPPTAQDPAVLRARAVEALGLPPGESPTREKTLVRYVEDSEGVRRWYRIFEARFEASPLTAIIDSDTAAIIGVRDDTLYGREHHPERVQLPGAFIEGNVAGLGVFFDPRATGTNLDHLDLSDLEVVAGDTETTHSDATGYFAFPQITLPTTLDARLKGRWAAMFEAQGRNLAFRNEPANPGIPVDLVFNDIIISEIYTSQVNGYFHTSFIHDWVKERLDGPLPAIDVPLPVSVNNFGKACNAGYVIGDDRRLVFHLAGFSPNFNTNCINTAFDTIIYHEYAHFVDDVTTFHPDVSGIMNGALSEGWGDLVATFAASDLLGVDVPVTGEGLSEDLPFWRSVDNDYPYPPRGDGAYHLVGQAWSGFGWHLRENLVTSLGPVVGDQTAEDLVIPTFFGNAVDIPHATRLVLERDDDGNLANGTPHLAEITDAAARHALFPFYSLTATSITDPPDSAVFNPAQQGTITVIGTADPRHEDSGLTFQSYQLFYGAGTSPQEWFSIGGGGAPVNNGVLGTWDISGLTNGIYQLRVVVHADAGFSFQGVNRVLIEGTPIRITDDPAAQKEPSMSGSRVVWQDERNGSQQTDIWLHDLATQTRVNLTNSPFKAEHPDVSGDLVVWEDRRNGPADIYLLDLGGGGEVAVTNDLRTQRGVAIADNIIVWEDERNPSHSDIVLCEYLNGQCTERWSTTDPFDQTNPDISRMANGKYRVVWEDQRQTDQSQEIYYCDFDPATGLCPETKLTDDSFVQENPAVWQNRIVWQQFSGGTWSVYIHDPGVGMANRLSNNAGFQTDPVISGNFIAWQDYRAGNWDIRMCEYNPSNGKCPTTAVTTHPDSQTLPAISGDIVVWQDRRDAAGDWEIYYQNLFNDPPSFVTPPTSFDVDAGETVSLQLNATDPDFDPIAYQVSGAPFGATLHAQTRVFSYTPTNSQAGTYYVTFSATDPEGASDTLPVQIDVSAVTNRITPSTANQRRPAITAQMDGDLVVWEDDRDGNDEIYLYDPSTGVTGNITTNPADQIDPFMYGRRIYWQDRRDGDWNIFTCLYNGPGNCPEQQISYRSTPPFNYVHYVRAENPVRSNDYVVWQGWWDYFGFDYDIWLYDMNAHAEYGLTHQVPGSQMNPTISANLVGWQDNRGGDWDIYLCEYDPLNPQGSCPEQRITTDPGDQVNPVIFGHTVMWQDNRNGNDDIYYCIYDPGTGDCSPKMNLTDHPANQTNPEINGGVRIVWQDDRSGDWDIYVCEYDFVECPIRQLTGHPANQEFPAMSTDSYGEIVVWQDDRNGNADIFYSGFDNNPPVITPTDDRHVRPGTTVQFRVYGTDPDGDPLSYSALGLPPGATFSPADQLFNWTPASAHAGNDYSVTFIVDDPFGMSDSVTITIEVRQPGGGSKKIRFEET